MADDKSATAPEPDWESQKDSDEREIERLLAQTAEGTSGGLKIDDAPFDQTNKADDAEDFEDISDDELPDEEPAVGGSFELPGLTDDGGTSNDPDDLFGEGPSPPSDPVLASHSPGARVRDTEAGDETQPTDATVSFPGPDFDPGINFDPEPHANGFANQDFDIPAPAENQEELVKAAYPAFKKGHMPIWSEIIPPKSATYKDKKPTRKPKRLVTSKLVLELAPDDITSFRLPGPQTSAPKHRSNDVSGWLIRCDAESNEEESEAAIFNLDQSTDSELVKGFSLRDIEMACLDFGSQINEIEVKFGVQETAEKEASGSNKPNKRPIDTDDDWDAEFLMDTEEASKPKPKKRRIYAGLPEIPRYAAPSFDNFQEATRRGAKRVHLDVSDPHLLIETAEPSRNSKRQRLDGTDSKRMAHGKMGRDLASRFNLSNDEAYDLLKENHQSKVRATLGNISVEHSLPATKLTWPYYKVKLPGTTDEYHRPRFRYKKFIGQTIRFNKPQSHRRKHMRGKAPDVFKTARDLSISDNSTAVLFEYCEPRPRVLNNFGMGSKLINYYRRKDTKDEEQPPKQDLGEFRPLLPEDRSPFALFGTVDAGETVPTLHNEMYRAPVFKHAPKSSDFLIVRNTTGSDGSSWFLHKIDHMHVVGQTFPSVEVPGPHSRKVTNASKNRMKMLAFRMIRHNRTNNCQLADITKHIADSTDTQNRQKLKEFLQYDRDSTEKGMWRLKLGEILPDELAVRAMIKAEEVCLLDSMQLGMKELEDAGYDPRNANFDEEVQNDAEADEEEDDEASRAPKAAGGKKGQDKTEETLADKLAPWKTSKAFIDACAGKAMLQLHGEGDPTGHGLGFSFIRTSMKGGYIETVQGPLATSADAMEREKRANGGHAYNVKKQQAMYEEGIREIWDKQKTTLSDAQEHDDKDVATIEDEDDRFNAAPTPAQFDDGTSQISGFTSASRRNKRTIRITREIRMPDGTTQPRIEVVQDPVVIAQYMKRRAQADLELKDIYTSRPTGDANHDRMADAAIKKELDRLEKNKARRQAREQQKELHHKTNVGDAGSPGPNPAGDKVATGTTRKCANCGQVGHIKTNKKNRSRGEHTAIDAIKKAMRMKTTRSGFKLRTEEYKRKPSARQPFDWWGVGNLQSSSENPQGTSITKQQRKPHPVIKSIEKAIRNKQKKANEQLRRHQQLARQQETARKRAQKSATKTGPRHQTTQQRRPPHPSQRYNNSRHRNPGTAAHRRTQTSQQHTLARAAVQRRRQDEAEARAVINRFADEFSQLNPQQSAAEAAKARQARDERRQAILSRTRPNGQNLTKSKYFN